MIGTIGGGIGARLIWLPWVASGAIWAVRRGQNQCQRREPPTAWALLIQAALSIGVVTALLPLAWDRYFLDFQPAAALLAAGATVAAVDRLRSWWGSSRSAA